VLVNLHGTIFLRARAILLVRRYTKVYFMVVTLNELLKVYFLGSCLFARTLDFI
jgi:hypothetical protein